METNKNHKSNNLTINSLPTEILEMVLDYLNLKNSANCRLVSRRFSVVATNIFKKRAEHHFIEINADKSLKCFNIEEYLNYLNVQRGLPFPSIRLKYSNLEDPICQNLFNGFGHTIKKLEIQFHRIPPNKNQFLIPVNNAQALKRIFLNQCKNLTHFFAGHDYYSIWDEDPTLSKGFLLEVDKAENGKALISTKITSLHIRHNSDLFIKDILTISPLLENMIGPRTRFETSSLISILTEKMCLNKLKFLELSGSDFKINEGLVEMGRELRLLKYYHSDICLDANFIIFLNSQSEHLKDLEIRGIKNSGQSLIISLPEKFPKLQKFKCNQNNNHTVNFQPGNFLKRFPNLEKLDISGGPSENYLSLFDLDSEPQLKLTHLEIPSQMSLEGIQKFRKILPNVKVLNIRQQRVQVIQSCYSLWPGIVSFEFNPDFNNSDDKNVIFKGILALDSLLTGYVSEEEIKNAEKSGIDKYPATQPSISSLKDLKRLHIETTFTVGFCLSGFGVMFGLQKINLDYFKIPMCKITEEAIQELEINMGTRRKSNNNYLELSKYL